MLMMPPPAPSAPTGAQGHSPSASSDPRAQLAGALQGVMEIVDAINQNFPGGEEQIRQALQSFTEALQMKLLALGQPEPPGPPIPA